MTTGRLLLSPGRAGLRRRLPPLAAGFFALVARPYRVVLSTLLALASFASDDPEVMSP
jgi:hypothetical protein